MQTKATTLSIKTKKHNNQREEQQKLLFVSLKSIETSKTQQLHKQKEPATIIMKKQ